MLVYSHIPSKNACIGKHSLKRASESVLNKFRSALVGMQYPIENASFLCLSHCYPSVIIVLAWLNNIMKKEQEIQI